MLDFVKGSLYEGSCYCPHDHCNGEVVKIGWLIRCLKCSKTVSLDVFKNGGFNK